MKHRQQLSADTESRTVNSVIWGKRNGELLILAKDNVKVLGMNGVTKKYP